MGGRTPTRFASVACRAKALGDSAASGASSRSSPASSAAASSAAGSAACAGPASARRPAIADAPHEAFCVRAPCADHGGLWTWERLRQHGW